MNRRQFFFSPFIIRQVIVDDGRWIEKFIPQKYVNDKYYLRRHLLKFSEALNVPVDLLMYHLRYVELSKENQKYLAIKGRNNGRVLELRIGVADYKKVDYVIGLIINVE